MVDEGSALEGTQGVVFECACVSVFSDLVHVEVLRILLPLTSHLTALLAPWTIADTPVCHRASISLRQNQEDRASGAS